MRGGSLYTLLCIFFISLQVSAKPYCPEENFWRQPTPGDAIEHIVETHPSQRLDFDNLKVLVWNIYKGGKSGIYTDLNILTQDIDLALLQEAHLSRTFLNLACQRNDLNWKLARNFTDANGIYAGVMTAGRSNPDDFYYLKSPGTEPFSNVHKMTMVTFYDLPDQSDQLMVLNIHGINFVAQKHFEDQITVAAEKIKTHTGPVIFAGDFNTYTAGRLSFLKKALGNLGLKQAEVKGNEYQGIIVLDHLFYRGLEITKTEVLKHINTSDHKPIYFELALQKTL